MSPRLNQLYYTVLEGMYSPRDNDYGFRVYGEYATKDAAMRAAKCCANAQILECRIIHEHLDGKRK